MVTVIPRQESLFALYPGQSSPQPCYLELDLQAGTLAAGWDDQVGNAVPLPVWQGLVRRYEIPCLRLDVVNRLMTDIAPLADQVIRGASVVWDGHNYVARLSNDAIAAEAEIEGECDQLFASQPEVFDAAGWLDDLDDAREEILARLAAGESVSALAAEIEAEAGKCFVTLVGLQQVLEAWAEEAREEEEIES